MNSIFRLLGQLSVVTKDEGLQADCTRDFLIACDSHPFITGFIKWGFRKPKHGKRDAAMFRKDRLGKPNPYLLRKDAIHFPHPSRGPHLVLA